MKQEIRNYIQKFEKNNERKCFHWRYKQIGQQENNIIYLPISYDFLSSMSSLFF